MLSPKTAKKLRGVKVSPRFTVILDALIGDGEVRADDEQLGTVHSLSLTSDGFLIAHGDRHDGFVGTRDDLERNLRGVARVAELSLEELSEVIAAMSRLEGSWS